VKAAAIAESCFPIDPAKAVSIAFEISPSEIAKAKPKFP